MPRTARQIVANYCYHFINRGNNRARIFHESADYAHFLALMNEATKRVSLDVFAVTLMPNHVHAVIQPHRGDDPARWAHWLFTTHARRHHIKYGTEGRVWQGRFKSFVIQQDAHLLTVLRYVERNALRAGLVSRAEDWLWGSLRWRAEKRFPMPIAESPIKLGDEWQAYVNEPQSPAELVAIRTCVNRQRPFGDAQWVESKARELGLLNSLYSTGPRPR